MCICVHAHAGVWLLACLRVCSCALACMRCPPPAVKVGRFLDGCVQPLMTSRVFSAARDGGVFPRHHFLSLFSVFFSFSFICLQFASVPLCKVWRSLAAPSWTQSRGNGDEKGGAKGRGRRQSERGGADFTWLESTSARWKRRPLQIAETNAEELQYSRCTAWCLLINGQYTFLFILFTVFLKYIFLGICLFFYYHFY